MASTNKTPHYDLPQFIGTDKPSWLGDVNGAMLAIDTALYSVKTDSQDAATSAISAQAAAQSAASSAEQAATGVTELTTEVAKLKTDLSATETQVTTSANAITQLQSQVAVIEPTITQLQTDVQQAQTTASAASVAASNAQNGVSKLTYKDGQGRPLAYGGTPGVSGLQTHISVTDNSSYWYFEIHCTGIVISQNAYINQSISIPGLQTSFSGTVAQSHISIDLSQTTISAYKYNSGRSNSINIPAGGNFNISWSAVVDANKEYFVNLFATLSIPKSSFQ